VQCMFVEGVQEARAHHVFPYFSTSLRMWIQFHSVVNASRKLTQTQKLVFQDQAQSYKQTTGIVDHSFAPWRTFCLRILQIHFI